MGEDIQIYFPKAITIPISPDQDDIRNYVVMRLDRDIEREAMNDDLRGGIVKSILDKVSSMYVVVSPLLTIFTYQRLCLDSSSFR